MAASRVPSFEVVTAKCDDRTEQPAERPRVCGCEEGGPSLHRHLHPGRSTVLPNVATTVSMYARIAVLPAACPCVSLIILSPFMVRGTRPREAYSCPPRGSHDRS